ncbi:MAG: pyridoxamine 5'-phosphate oxidase family protein, partial [Acidimicrobiales bacterium]
MGRVYESVDARMAEFLTSQPVFFVASAPLSPDGHVNLSPKGIRDTFVVVDPNTVAYLDLTGSGVETIAHLRENGRITLMFCAFEGKARIVRLHGRGRALPLGSTEFDSLVSRFPSLPGVRSIVVVDLTRISD